MFLFVLFALARDGHALLCMLIIAVKQLLGSDKGADSAEIVLDAEYQQVKHIIIGLSE